MGIPRVTRDVRLIGWLGPSSQESNSPSYSRTCRCALCAAVEWKGIKGADGRVYMLDLIRLTPRDPNFIPPTLGGTGVW